MFEDSAGVAEGCVLQNAVLDKLKIVVSTPNVRFNFGFGRNLTFGWIGFRLNSNRPSCGIIGAGSIGVGV